MLMMKELGLMLYWAEGDKSNFDNVALTNSDPNVMKYFIAWLRKYFEIDEKRIKCRLYIWKDTNETEAKTFWSDLLNVPMKNFTKSYISKSQPKIRKKRHNNGVCRICYSSTKFCKEILNEIAKLFIQ